jgi:hypothetical protein
MAAITPFLEQQNDPAETDLQKEAFREEGKAELQGLGRQREEVFFTGTITAEALNQSHAELLQMSWLRETVFQSLIGRPFRVQPRDNKGGRPREVFIILDDAERVAVPGYDEGGTVAAWNPPATPDAAQWKILSWTSKMGTPSFSLPAGPGSVGGSCPGAVAGQSIAPVQQMQAQSKRILQVLGRPVDLPRAICQHCYAEGGQYGTGGVQFAQVLRFIWTRMALKDGSFVPTMLYAVQNANYLLDGGTHPSDTKKAEKKTHYPRERHSRRYFRIHDSGDFFSPGYLRAWQEIAAQFPDILFWAPTRIWATNWGIDAAAGSPPNFVLRPSAYHINEPMPVIDAPGWAKPTVVYGVPKDKAATKAIKEQAVVQGAYDWDCQAYAVNDEAHTCRHALAPDGKPGCRACWRFGADATVNYTLH